MYDKSKQQLTSCNHERCIYIPDSLIKLLQNIYSMRAKVFLRQKPPEKKIKNLLYLLLINSRTENIPKTGKEIH